MNYPTDFEENTHLVEVSAGGAIEELRSRGYRVHYGLTKQRDGEIIDMTQEQGIREYCPNDSGKRFKDLSATQDWLSKGRAVFLLLNQADKLVGYGWAGAGTSDHVPSGETTFAIRIGQAGQGQGLAAPFSKSIVWGSAELFGSKNYWLETWQSNGAAVHVYHKIGFNDVTQQKDERPTADGGRLEDVRLYMSLPNELLLAT